MTANSSSGFIIAICLSLTSLLFGAPDTQPRNPAECLTRCLDSLGLRPDGILPSLRVPGPPTETPILINVPALDLGHALDVLTAAGEGFDSSSRAAEFLDRMFREAAITPQAGEVRDPPEDFLDAADSLDVVVRGGGRALRLLWRAQCRVLLACESLSPAETGELSGLLRAFSLQDDEWPHFPVRRMIELAGRVDLSLMASALITLDSAAAVFRGESLVFRPESLPFRLDTPLGEVVVLGEGNDSYSGAPLLLLDMGGDDSLCLAPRGPLSVGLVLDCGGDDRWIAADSLAAAALLGALWLEDLAGDDFWLGGDMGLGYAACGAAALVDRAGNDIYVSRSSSQGAALFGVCLALDCSGDDRRELGFFGQGALAGRGSVLLADLAGDDSYRCGGLHPDWREPGATKSFSQGAALGLRPFASGGLAVLYDRAGNDSHEAGYLGQGAGYWGGTGALIDRAGNDSYRALRYAQGAGLHFAAGLLLDCSGNDRYSLGSVGQGAGEDRALGLLVELGGDDSYESGWMVRGAAGAGGVGLLLDLTGNDRYAPARRLADGESGRHEELSGFGFLFDCAGEDLRGDSTDNGFIRRSGTWGASVDLEGGADDRE